MQVYIYIFLTLIVRAAAGLQNSHTHCCKELKLAIFLFLHVAGAFILEFFTYKGWKVLFYIDIHV